MSRLRVAADRLGTRLVLRAGVPAVFRRGGFGDPIPLTVVQTRPDRDREETGGGTLDLDDSLADFLVRTTELAAALAAGGDPDPEPCDGDGLEVDGVFYALAPRNDAPPWRYEDAGRRLIRLHGRESGPL